MTEQLSEKSKIKIAVTGATGHIGNNLCRMLIAQGYPVKALIHRDNKGLENLPLEYSEGDVNSSSSLEELCRGCGIVFHLAAYISIRRRDQLCSDLNVGGCINLIEAAKKTGVRKIIHFSSIHAFCEEPLNTGLNECRNLSIGSRISYNSSKALSQKLMIDASSGDLEIAVLNPTGVVGPYDFRPSFLGNAIIRFYNGKNPGLISGGYDLVDVRDVCAAAINAIQHGKPGECYLLGGGWQSIISLAGEIEKLGGHKPPGIKFSIWMAQLAAPLLNLHSYLTKKPALYTSMSLETLKKSHRNISCEKAAAALNFRPRPFSETISDTIKWFKENNYL